MKRWTELKVWVALATLFLLGVVGVSNITAADSSATAPWPMYLGNSQRDSRSSCTYSNLGESPLNLLWTRNDAKVGPWFNSWNMVVDNNNRLWLSTRMATEPQLIALNPQGETVANAGDVLLKDGIICTVIIGSDGTFYIREWVRNETPIFGGSNEGTGYLTALNLNPDGNLSLKWRTYLGSDYGSTILQGKDGTLYTCSIRTGDYLAVRAFDQNGFGKWSFLLPQERVGNFNTALGRDGTIYLSVYAAYPSADPRQPSCPFILYAISPDGKMEWKIFKDDINIMGGTQPVVGSDSEGNDTVYVSLSCRATEDPWKFQGKLIAVGDNGEIKWTKDFADDWIGYAPAIDADGTIYLSSLHYVLIALGPDGTEIWRYLKNPVSFSGGNPYPASISANGLVFVNSFIKKREGDYYVIRPAIYAIDKDGKLKDRFTMPEGVTSMTSAVIDDLGGRVYAAVYTSSWQQFLYAFGPQTP